MFDDPEFPFSSVSLGDIVTLPDGRALSVRAKADLPPGVEGVSAFVLLGELESLLVASGRPGDLVASYVPVDYLPPQATTARMLAEGAAAYWAPHLPAAAGAMGELLYRVLSLRSQVAPIILVYRGPELVVFVRASAFPPLDLRLLRMPQRADPVTVGRVAATVEPMGVPASAPVYQPLVRPVPTS